jgi:hypothetical protein
MARVNEAYGRHDLLALLTVQLEIEQIDADHLAGLPDKRLKHYCRVLREQLRAIEDEVLMVTEPLAMQLEVMPQRLKPTDMRKVLEQDIAMTRRACTQLAHDNQLLRQAASRPAFLRQLQIEDPDEEIDPIEEMLLMQALDDAMVEMSVDAKKRGRRRR